MTTTPIDDNAVVNLNAIPALQATDPLYAKLAQAQSQADILPEPPLMLRDQLRAAEDAGVIALRNSIVYDIRRWQIEQLGFARFAPEEFVRLLTGQEHTHAGCAEQHEDLEWVYNHHDDIVLHDTTWGCKPPQFWRTDRVRRWYLPPFRKQEVWRLQFGMVHKYGSEIPYDVMLKLGELKRLRLFNAFGIVAPVKLFQGETAPNLPGSILYGELWKWLDPDNADSAEESRYLIAQW